MHMPVPVDEPQAVHMTQSKCNLSCIDLFSANSHIQRNKKNKQAFTRQLLSSDNLR